jgi:UDP-N-acetylglucosamine 2-epimerase (non-hydrolysing)
MALASVSPVVANDGIAVLHVALSRSAAVRLSPIIGALDGAGIGQAIVDRAGALTGPSIVDQPPSTRDPDRSAALDAVRLVEAALEQTRPRLLTVAGDGDSALAAAMAASRRRVTIARIGAGLRCGDLSVMGEINRLVIDELADLLLTDGVDAADCLYAEGAEPTTVRCVGSTLPDVVVRWRDAAIARRSWSALGLPEGEYVLAALHKPENVADLERLTALAAGLVGLARRTPLVVSLPADAWAMLEDGRQREHLSAAGAVLTGSLDYLDFLSLESAAGAIITDSAGIQEETTVLGVPCFTVGRASERTLTLTHGSNVLLGDDVNEILEIGPLALDGHECDGIPLWDGDAGARAATALLAATGIPG